MAPKSLIAGRGYSITQGRQFMLRSLAVFAMTIAATGGALAATDEAWAQFAAEVEAACLAATAESLPEATVVVDPFGSESYGLAVVSGEAASIICVFDKQTKAVEIGGELPITVTAD
jgi:hypothetical protein